MCGILCLSYLASGGNSFFWNLSRFQKNKQTRYTRRESNTGQSVTPSLEAPHSTTELQVLGLRGVGFEPTRITPGVLKTPALTKLCYPRPRMTESESPKSFWGIQINVRILLLVDLYPSWSYRVRSVCVHGLEVLCPLLPHA
jgi:hypothetical protein